MATRTLTFTDHFGLITTSLFDSKERMVQQIAPGNDTLKVVCDDSHKQNLGITSSGGDITGEIWGGQVTGTVNRAGALLSNVSTTILNGVGVDNGYASDGSYGIAGDARFYRRYGDGLVERATLDQLKMGWEYGYSGILRHDSVTCNGDELYKQLLTYDSTGRIKGKTEIVNGDTVKWANTHISGRLASVTKNGTLLASDGWDANGNRAGSAVDSQASQKGD